PCEVRNMKRLTAIATCFVVFAMSISQFADRPRESSGHSSVAAGANSQTTTATLETDHQLANRVASYGNLPLSFEANRGQTSPDIKFATRGQGSTAFLNQKGLVILCSPDHAKPLSNERHHKRPPSTDRRAPLARGLRMSLIGADPNSEILGADRLGGRVNYVR